MGRGPHMLLTHPPFRSEFLLDPNKDKSHTFFAS